MRLSHLRLPATLKTTMSAIIISVLLILDQNKNLTNLALKKKDCINYLNVALSHKIPFIVSPGLCFFLLKHK